MQQIVAGTLLDLAGMGVGGRVRRTIRAEMGREAGRLYAGMQILM